MRKVLISIAAAGTALAFATPASAQYFPQGQSAYGYAAPYGAAYGYRGGGQTRALQMRVDVIERQIEQLRARRALSRDEVNGLRAEAQSVEQRLRRSSRYGLDRNEMRDISYRIARLEQHVRHEARDGNRYGYNGRNGGYGYNNSYASNGYANSGYYADRDRDGRNDNDEHDRWHDQHDGHDNDDD